MNPRATEAPPTRPVRNPPKSSKAAANSPAHQSRNILALPLILTGLFLVLGFISRARTNSHLAWTYFGVAAFLLCWQLVLFLGSKRKGIVFGWEFAAVRSHYVQAAVQMPIYAYWGLYWPRVY